MERRHEEELRKLKANRDQLEACLRHPQGDEHFAHTLLERTQGESHPWHTVNTRDYPSISLIHHPTGRTGAAFVDLIMEDDIPLGWKPLNLERYDGTTDPNEHLEAFLTRQICTPMMMQSCVVSSQHPLKGWHWPGTVDFPQGPLTASTLLLSVPVCNMQPVGHIVWHRLL